MARRNPLRRELSLLEQTFPRGHSQFQITSANMDEVTCVFVGPPRFRIQCNISVDYPATKPYWFADGDQTDVVVASILEELTSLPDSPHPILSCANVLISRLCEMFGYAKPDCCSTLLQQFPVSDRDGEMEDEEDEDEPEEDDEDDEDDNVGLDGIEDHSDNDTVDSGCGLDSDSRATLERVKISTRDEYVKGTVSGSVQASDRLMKDLRDIYRSAGHKDGMFSVELVEDNLYEWMIRLKQVDPDSPLYGDLKKLKEKENKDYIQLSMTFSESFPFAPPFVRVIYPVLTGGYVLNGGAVCMELLTPQGWSSAYSLEAVILQIAATLVKGKARIQFGTSNSCYSLHRAQQAFRSLVEIHVKNGWYTPPKQDG
ncbi:ubiquitin-conjugating enzyme E2 Q2-like [Corticium candelabrum]|uniref:ubiquitin-conjugating enzyme E2 Q2-like n=1 Tax=Corticium candelabrum TaxID=121492 RepID=UPI002E2751F6|nr:ubiquitin-conjugating enzyme E2 Q2-like [Corticium candelabrum]